MHRTSGQQCDMSIRYTTRADEITESMLEGPFFKGWPHPPTPAVHRRILCNSAHAAIAIDTDFNRVVGFVNAISDGVHAAFIPLLEVLPDYRRRGIARELIRRILAQLDGYYSIDLMCDPDVQPFYQGLGEWRPSTGMSIRYFDRQSCGIKPGSGDGASE